MVGVQIMTPGHDQTMLAMVGLSLQASTNFGQLLPPVYGVYTPYRTGGYLTTVSTALKPMRKTRKTKMKTPNNPVASIYQSHSGEKPPSRRLQLSHASEGGACSVVQ
jgi:hypothetical protein